MHMVAWILLIIGGLNWLLIGLFDWGIGKLFMNMGTTGTWIERLIYILVGLSAIWELATHKSNCRMCNPSGMPAKTM
jgi:uncharacterized membrane protein YuzA (DUF378 family)